MISVDRRFSWLVAAIFGALALSASAADSSCGSGKMWIPPGSKIDVVSASTLRVLPPAGWAYLGVNANGLLEEIPPEGGGSCSCDCTSSSGNCMPSILEGNCSCTASGGRTACSLKTGGASLAGAGFAEGGFVDLSADVRFVRRGEILPAVFGSMLTHPKVREGLERFLAKINADGPSPELIVGPEGFRAPKGWRLAPVSVFGRAAFVVIPADAFFEEVPPEDGGGGGSCSCSAGSCTHKSQWVPGHGTLHYCEGNCSGTCTLTVSLVAETRTFENSGH